MSGQVSLKSDFSDYYDNCFGISEKVYNRFRSGGMSRAKALRFLEGLGFKTIRPSRINEISPSTKRVVVYTNPKQHNGQGKEVYTYQTAVNSYSNYICTPFIEGTKGQSMKIVQVGSKRYRVLMQNNDFENKLGHGVVTNISEITSGLNPNIKLPIFSIDYIPYNDTMLVTDFNEVQNLGDLGFAKLLTPDLVVSEIEKVLYH